ncbi:uncharacterized protein [Anoplolepis gracilipes]|uniref:uncharacterized protein n=1 Tax=Anoplolepis gracilipes TaxID=354296 RepID=UPI003B9FDA8A
MQMLKYLNSLTLDGLCRNSEPRLEWYYYAIILAHNLQPQKVITHSSVKASLDSITYEVLNCLREKHPDHSIFSMPVKEDFHDWLENTWNETEGTQIINSIGEYLLGKLNFRLNQSKELKYMCIDYVLESKCGQELILLIICYCVANRLGVDFHIILEHPASDRRLYLIWFPRDHRNTLEMVTYFTVRSNEFPSGFMKQRFLLWDFTANSTILGITSAEEVSLQLCVCVLLT